MSRLACIETEGSMYICSDQDSASCDNEVRSKEDNAISDDEAEIVDLMKRVELMKKERSIHWLREFKEWMDLASDSFADGNKCGSVLDSGTENYMKKKASQRHLGESSRYVSDSVQASGNENGANILESDKSFADISIGLVPQYFDHGGESAAKFALRDTGVDVIQDDSKSYTDERVNCVPVKDKETDLNDEGSSTMVPDVNAAPLTVIDDIMESHLSSDFPGSPPHYQEDLLHRRHILVEDILQLSAESYSVASSDSNTSDSNDLCEVESSVSEVEQSVNGEFSSSSVDGQSMTRFFDNVFHEQGLHIPQVRENGRYFLDSHAEQASAKLLKPEQSLQLCSDVFSAGAHDGEIVSFSNKEADWLDKKKCKRKSKRRVVSLSPDNMVGRAEVPQTSNGNPDVCGGDMEGEPIFGWNCLEGFVDGERTCASATITPHIDDSGRIISRMGVSSTGADDFIKNYFNLSIADSSVNETCMQHMQSSCFLELESRYTER